jgi:hypothetical protein
MNANEYEYQPRMDAKEQEYQPRMDAMETRGSTANGRESTRIEEAKMTTGSSPLQSVTTLLHYGLCLYSRSFASIRG